MLIPDNYTFYEIYEREQERQDRLHIKYEELYELEESPFYEGEYEDEDK